MKGSGDGEGLKYCRVAERRLDSSYIMSEGSRRLGSRVLVSSEENLGG